MRLLTLLPHAVKIAYRQSIPALVAATLGLESMHDERAYRGIDQKCATTRYLHLPRRWCRRADYDRNVLDFSAIRRARPSMACVRYSAGIGASSKPGPGWNRGRRKACMCWRVT